MANKYAHIINKNYNNGVLEISYNKIMTKDVVDQIKLEYINYFNLENTTNI